MSHESLHQAAAAPAELSPEEIAQTEATQRAETFDRIAEFSESPEREFAAGPDIRKATGLLHEDVMKLGYNSYADLESAVLAERAAETDQAAAVEARAEGIFYRKKLENGGEIGLKRMPGLEAQLRDEALSEASAEQEANQPPQTDKPTDNADGPDYAGRHRKPDHRQEGGLESRGKHRKPVTPMAELGEQWVTEAQSGSKHAAEKLSTELAKRFEDADKDELSTAYLMNALYDQANARLTKASEVRSGRMDEPPLRDEITDSSPKGLRARVKRIFAKGHDMLSSATSYANTKYTMGLQRSKEYFGDEEKGKKRKVVAWGLGAVAAVAAGVALYKGIDVGQHHTKDAHDAAPTVSPSGGGSAAGHHSAATLAGASQGHEAAHHAAQAHAEAATLHYRGDTIWTEVKRHLTEQNGKKPSNAEVLKHTRATLKANGLTWGQARRLPIGYEFRIV